MTRVNPNCLTLQVDARATNLSPYFAILRHVLVCIDKFFVRFFGPDLALFSSAQYN